MSRVLAVALLVLAPIISASPARTQMPTAPGTLMLAQNESNQTGSYRPPPHGMPDNRVGAAARDLGQQERRVALVIGNGAYQHLPRLANPVNDTELMATTLKSVGFQLVGGKAQTDLDRPGLERAIRQFGAELKEGAVGLFYYAGHGLQVQGANYLVPVAADPTTAADVDFELIDANLVLKQMESAGSKLNILILDACRNNPFGGRGLRDAGAGLAPMRTPRGTLISYATQPGNTAMDGTAGHSPYTAALAESIKRPGLQVFEVFEVFNEVALSVDKTSGGRQQPWVSISPLEGVFYFLGPTTVNVNPTPAAPPKLVPPSPDTETVFWQSVSQSTNPADFEEYLRKYPNGQFAGLARNKLALLRPAAAAPNTRPAGQQNEISAEEALKKANAIVEGPLERQNFTEAARWYRRAAELGSAEAQKELANLLEKGLGGAQSYSDAAQWYARAADNQSGASSVRGDAASRVGLMYYEGKGVSQNYSEALNWFRKAANQGNSSAQFMIGSMYEAGRGVQKDSAQAMRWWENAVSKDGSMYFAIGVMYRNGAYGVSRDPAKASVWLKKAAAAGFPGE